MKKFEDADKRRKNQVKGELELLREELRYLKEEKERLAKIDKDNEEFRKDMDKRMAGLEIRIRRLERYLAMDETMIEYYQTPRSPWEIVKRSAIFPGWGHRYAREEYTGNIYSTAFISLFVLGYLINFQAKLSKSSVKNDFNNRLALSAFLGGSGGILLFNTYISYDKKINEINNRKQFENLFINGAILLYGIQLVHAFTGVEWAKSSPRDHNESLLKSPVS